MQASKPIITPNEVKGFLGSDARKPDRLFYILFEDQIWEWDGYCVHTADRDCWSINIVCPRCHNNLRLDSTLKRLQVTADSLETDEPIRCSHVAEFGGLCSWRVELAPPRKREERYIEVGSPTGVARIKIDAVARNA